jgi:hypothetical protein
MPSTPTCGPVAVRTAGPLKASTVHEVHAVLSGALKQAVGWGWVGHNPAKLATAPSVQKADVQPPQAEDATDALAFGTTLAAEAYVFSRVADGSQPIDPDGISHRFLRLARRLA